ncbi:hypothetical protein GCK72_011043 [Caenorhabditis remanei]|uniref:Uncharacterized protein n=1 Tax=Caenorhabditis remanei TaxID=31234 RepID=A0A6A5H4I8_CAERE|nr:hypothetical protein GCK72_011043 [Caenorhabditis remanei]KAF1762780.1 hypothetical protein GCK72_011043 [Caenorhabditis remanei]
MDPNGPQLFGEDIMKLIKNNVPSGVPYSNCRVGIMLESDETSEAIELSFKPLKKLSSEDIVQSMEEMSQWKKCLNLPSGNRRKTSSTRPGFSIRWHLGKSRKQSKTSEERGVAQRVAETGQVQEPVNTSTRAGKLTHGQTNFQTKCFDPCIPGSFLFKCRSNYNANAKPNIDPKTSPPETTTIAVETTESLITTSTTGSSNTKTIIVTCCIIGVVILLCVGIAVFYFRRKKASSGTKDINSVESNSKTNKKNKKDAQFARY